MRAGLTILGLVIFLPCLLLVGAGIASIGTPWLGLAGLLVIIFFTPPLLFGLAILIWGLTSKSYRQCYFCGMQIESGIYDAHLRAAHSSREPGAYERLVQTESRAATAGRNAVPRSSGSYCPNCGSTVNIGTEWCGKCGTKLS